MRGQQPRMCKNSNPQMKCDSAIGRHLKKAECAKTYTDDVFRVIEKAIFSFHLKCFVISLRKDSKTWSSVNRRVYAC